jgi:ankyrin repeat protein
MRTALTTRLIAALLAGLLAGSLQAQDLPRLIQQGERKAALELIRKGTDVNALQPDGSSALHWAVYQVDEELVDALLRAEAKPDVINNFGSSPLAEAIKVGNFSLVQKLLNAGADANYRNQDNQSALMLAVSIGAVEIAELLLQRGADVNLVEQLAGQTALMWAAGQGSAPLTQLLLANGADATARSFINDWPAQITGEPRAQYRPAAGLTVLQFAVRSGCMACIDALLDAGASIDEPTPEGVTPLMIAIDNNHYDVALHLLDKGANPHIWDWWGRTALYTAIDMHNGGNSTAGTSGMVPGRAPKAVRGVAALDVARRLLELGVDPEPQLNFHRPGRGGGSGRFVDDLMNTGATPMLRAAINWDIEGMALLQEYGANVDLPNLMGVTPFMAAAQHGVSALDPRFWYTDADQQKAIAALDFLLKAGADPNARIQDVTSLTARIARPSQLTERGGQTALYGAIKYALVDVVAWLIDNGAEVDIVDDLGVSPLDAAEGRIGGRDNRPSDVVADLIRAALEKQAAAQ